MVNLLWPRVTGTAVLAVLDADSRPKVANGEIRLSEQRVAYLPGDCTPEALVMGALATSPKVVAQRLGVTSTELLKALTSAEGLDHHDQPEGVAKILGVTPDHLVETALRTVLSEEPFRSAAIELTTRLAALAAP